jgi:hypothetical protein
MTIVVEVLQAAGHAGLSGRNITDHELNRWLPASGVVVEHGALASRIVVQGRVRVLGAARLRSGDRKGCTATEAYALRGDASGWATA